MAKRKRKPRNRPESKPLKPKASYFQDMLASILEETKPVIDKETLTPTEKRWFEFKEAGYEDQIALCHKTIEEKDLMDGENAFEMFNTLFYATVEHNERHRFEELVNKLRERLPDIFAQQAHYILDWQITNALAERRMDDVLPLAQELAQVGGKHLDMFTHTLDALDYHDQLSVLLKVMPVAWTDVKGSSGYFEWAIDEFASRAVDYIVFGYLELNPALEANDPKLLKKISFYLGDINQDFFANYLHYLTGRVGRKWMMSDFGFERKSQGKKKSKKPAKTAKLSDEARQNLYNLTVEFSGYLRQEKDVPYTKSRMARGELHEYLSKRHAGELEPQESMFEAAMRDPWKRRRKPKMRYPDHWLCPDRATLDAFLARLLGFLSGRYYSAIAVFELIPAWLQFLESRQLIDAEQHAKTLQNLQGLNTDLLNVVKTHPDPTLARATKQWGKVE